MEDEINRCRIADLWLEGKKNATTTSLVVIVTGEGAAPPHVDQPVFLPGFFNDIAGWFWRRNWGWCNFAYFFFLRQWKQHLQIDEIRYDWSSWIKMIKWLIIVTPPKTNMDIQDRPIIWSRFDPFFVPRPIIFGPSISEMKSPQRGCWLDHLIESDRVGIFLADRIAKSQGSNSGLDGPIWCVSELFFSWEEGAGGGPEVISGKRRAQL